ncbi:hypothetical protein [Marinimicrobium alkaliphilum]|uniref:hypothetical protein n=1 Tax=Marinimicrobium alkaliphilum TaxID=2202654 RepID=UPI000DBA3640|nr:hypothetical protein [Marinimicrobium alkaliphilum]
MPSYSLSQDDLLASREIRFINRQESNYPQLMRMCMDFDFRVLQLMHRPANDTEGARYAFVLTTRDYRADEKAAITPSLASLAELDAYVSQHQVDILHDYLFGYVENDDTKLGHQQPARE